MKKGFTLIIMAILLIAMAVMGTSCTNEDAVGAGLTVVMAIIYLGVIILIISSLWKIFSKAGKPGWAAIVPIYNIIVMLEIVDKPLWWTLLYFIPIVSLVIGIMVIIELAARFGKSTSFAIGMILLPIIFYPILAFGNSQYKG